MKFASLLVNGQAKNAIFGCDLQNNPDNWYYPYGYLKRQFEINEIELNTSDVNIFNDVAFELHMDAQAEINSTIPCYVMLYETPQIRPINQNKSLLAKYRRIFTWRDEWVDGERYIKLNLPNKIIINDSFGWHGRDKLCCIIAGNKALKSKSPFDLYAERVRTVRWFEKNSPQDFDLFGVGWDGPAARHGLLGRVMNRLQQFIPSLTGKVFFPSYRGKVVSKLETLQKYRFSICYENVRELPGYITEKIFDSFFAGCIPVYWGASNINSYIPEDCFIDRRKFTSHEVLYNFMTSMTESEFTDYQKRIAAFLTSDRAKPFSAEVFAETIVNTIVSDLGNTI